MKYTDRIGTYWTSSTGEKFFVVFLTVKNTGETTVHTNPFNVYVAEASGKEYSHSIATYSMTDYFTASDLSPGSTNSGWLVFDIPSTVTPSKLNYKATWKTYSSNIDSSSIKQEFNKAPRAHIEGDRIGFVDEEAEFDGSGSSDPENDTLTYSWDFGDDSFKGYDAKATHTYEKPGTYTVELIVSDGILTNSINRTITINHYFALTVKSYRYVDDPESYHNGDLEVTFQVSSIGEKQHALYTSFFEVKTTDGISYGWEGDDGSAPSSISPGASAIWSAYFKVPTSKTPRTLIYDGVLEAPFP